MGSSQHPLLQHYLDRLHEREQEGARRGLKPNTGLIDFCSNDYLGLAASGLMEEALREKVARAPLAGATGSRLLTGEHEFISRLERRIAAFHLAESALLFSSGYAANSGLLSTICRRGDVLLYDKLIHASMREGVQLSRARSFSFRHNDLEDLTECADKLSRMRTKGELSADAQVVVAVESVYSMDGDSAPLQEIAALCKRENWALVVDEAHAVGVLGKHGAGLVPDLDLEDEVFARVVTYGKAFGASGGAIIGSKTLRDWLINYCKAFIYSTALSGVQAALIGTAYDLVEAADDRRAQLKKLQEGFDQRSSQSDGYPGAVRRYMVPGNAEVIALSATLAEAGIDCRPIRYPTVAKGEERLRISLHAHNSMEELATLLAALPAR